MVTKGRTIETGIKMTIAWWPRKGAVLSKFIVEY